MIRSQRMGVQQVKVTGFLLFLLHAIVPRSSVGQTTYDGRNMNFTEIPQGIRTDAGEILLSENTIVDIPANAFSSFTALETLDLSKCGIVKISDFAFSGTPLQHLYLEKNYLNALPNLTSVASTLQHLDVSHNPIRDIPPEVFMGLVSLKSLSLKTTQLTKFPDFSDLPSDNLLEDLFVSGNAIKVLNSTMLANLPKLQLLSIARNELTQFPDLTPVASTLRTLHININQIILTKGDFGTFLAQFKCLTSLETVRLKDNKLHTFPNVLDITELTSLVLTENPLVCDCFLGWMKLPQVQNYGLDLSDKPCSEPVELVNIDWGGITMEQLCPGIKGFSVDSDEINWAVNKTTFQSSGSGDSRKAADGDIGGNYFSDGCMETDLETNPWWAVDLGEEIAISDVTVANRQDCCSERLHDYSIGATNTSPSQQVPAPGNYDLCKFVEGVAPMYVAITCDLVVRGRYLVIQIAGLNEILTLCEVGVYGSPLTTSTLPSPETSSSATTSGPAVIAPGIGPHTHSDVNPVLALDNFPTTCTSRTFTKQLWWLLEIAKPTEITGVHLVVSAQTTLLDIEVLVAANATSSAASADTRDNYAECARETINDANGVSLKQSMMCATVRTSQKVWLLLTNLGQGQNIQLEMCDFFVLSE